MKYQLSSAKRPVARKPFDFTAAAEALAETLDQARCAYDEYVAAEGRVLEVEGVLSDCQQALESISKFGVVPQNMALLNEGNGLDRALGLENLAIESLNSLSNATKVQLQKQYCAGLENKATEMIATAVERIKDFFAKLLEWLKEFFTGNAKVVKMVSEAKFELAPADLDKKINALPYDQAKSLCDAMEGMLKQVKEISENSASAVAGVVLGSETKIDIEIGGKKVAPEKKSDTIKALDYTTSNVGTLKSDFLKAAKPDEMNTAWKKIQQNYKELIRGSGGAEFKDKLTAGFDALRAAAKATSVYGKALKLVGFSLLAIDRASSGAEAPKA